MPNTRMRFTEKHEEKPWHKQRTKLAEPSGSVEAVTVTPAKTTVNKTARTVRTVFAAPSAFARLRAYLTPTYEERLAARRARRLLVPAALILAGLLVFQTLCMVLCGLETELPWHIPRPLLDPLMDALNIFSLCGHLAIPIGIGVLLARRYSGSAALRGYLRTVLPAFFLPWMLGKLAADIGVSRVFDCWISLRCSPLNDRALMLRTLLLWMLCGAVAIVGVSFLKKGANRRRASGGSNTHRPLLLSAPTYHRYHLPIPGSR